jgi:Ni/Fe-hydrogenase subunit HybB-like protein
MQQRDGISLALGRSIVSCLAVLLVVGVAAYGYQFRNGLGVTGMSRNVPWGLYISQFTFLVGIAASSVLVILPHYVHGNSDFEPLVLVGESISVSALFGAISFVLVDLGQPSRVLAVILYASPTSLMFWDIVTLTVYFLLCSTILTTSLVLPKGSHPNWLRPLILLSVPFAFGIHVVTALIYSGLAARAGWMTAILAPKFLATAFASGSALLMLLSSALRGMRRLRIEPATTARLATVMTYALCATLLFTALEVFTGVYSGIPSTEEHAVHLLVPSGHSPGPASLMLFSLALSLVALGILLTPATRQRSTMVHWAGAMVLVSVLVEKGFTFILSGFIPSAFGENVAYHPSTPEVLIAGGIYAGAMLIFGALLGPVTRQLKTSTIEIPDKESSCATSR